MELVIMIGLFMLIAWVAKKMEISKKGREGETRVRKELKKLGKSYKVINDIYVPKGSSSYAQCDHVVVSRYGIFVIETKNYKGKMKDLGRDTWEYTLGCQRHTLYSPVAQNKEHVKQVLNFLGRHGVDIKQSQVKSLIVFSGKGDISEIKDRNVIELDALINTIKKVNMDIPKSTVVKVCDLLEKEKGSWRKRIVHVNNIKKNKRMSKNKCPLCGKSLAIRDSANGKFIGCTGYPNCRYKKEMR